MRSATLAVATAVALLTNATVAHAGSPAPTTTAVAGYCEWSAEPDLFELTELVADADCASDAAVVINPHLVAEVTERHVYDGKREMGKPSGTEREISSGGLPATNTISIARREMHESSAALASTTTNLVEPCFSGISTKLFRIRRTSNRHIRPNTERIRFASRFSSDQMDSSSSRPLGTL